MLLFKIQHICFTIIRVYLYNKHNVLDPNIGVTVIHSQHWYIEQTIFVVPEQIRNIQYNKLLQIRKQEYDNKCKKKNTKLSEQFQNEIVIL